MFSPIWKVSKHLAKSSINIWAFFCFLQCNPHRLFLKVLHLVDRHSPAHLGVPWSVLAVDSQWNGWHRLPPSNRGQLCLPVPRMSCSVKKTHNKLNLIAFPLFFFIFLSMLRSVPKIEKLLKKKKHIF